jgi:hypothetical protein
MFALIVPAVLFAIADGMRDLALSMLLVGALGVFAALMVSGLDFRVPAFLGAGLGLPRARRDVAAGTNGCRGNLLQDACRA